jgi:hypothetical protein
MKKNEKTQHGALMHSFKFGDNTMAGKIFYRERSKAKEGSRTPRYRIIAVSGIDLKVYADHLRRKEIEQIAKETKSDLILLKRDSKSEKK